MRCRPGELAWIVRCPEAPHLLGRTVTTHYVVPVGMHSLPNGMVACVDEPDAWVIEFQRPERVPTSDGDVVSLYSIASDLGLRPIRPDADPVETETEREVTA